MFIYKQETAFNKYLFFIIGSLFILYTDNQAINNQRTLVNNECRVVNQRNVLWTCHKACKIEFSDCAFCMCSVCYAKKIESGAQTMNKRRRVVRQLDDDPNVCKHNLSALVPFTDEPFFSDRYKDKIRHEKYTLPLNCSICHNDLVSKLHHQY